MHDLVHFHIKLKIRYLHYCVTSEFNIILILTLGMSLKLNWNGEELPMLAMIARCSLIITLVNTYYSPSIKCHSL